METCLKLKFKGNIFQTIAMVLLICTLLFFSSQMRDDPLPTEAVIENSKLGQVNEEAEVVVSDTNKYHRK